MLQSTFRIQLSFAHCKLFNLYLWLGFACGPLLFCKSARSVQNGNLLWILEALQSHSAVNLLELNERSRSDVMTTLVLSGHGEPYCATSIDSGTPDSMCNPELQKPFQAVLPYSGLGQCLQVTEYVEDVLTIMELGTIGGLLVGIPGQNGLSVEQRKRLTIAVELVANPRSVHSS